MASEEIEIMIQGILNDRGIKQKWLREQVGLSSSAISQIVRGESIPELITALKISKALGLKVEDIWKLK